MLLNFSNHSSANWPENQLEAASNLFGVILDLPFPDVDPELNETELVYLCTKYLKEIKSFNPIAVHIMGELNLCFQLITLLKSDGITCLASTTHRSVEEHDGIKKSHFVFVRFRAY